MTPHLKLAYDTGVTRALEEAGITKVAVSSLKKQQRLDHLTRAYAPDWEAGKSWGSFTPSQKHEADYVARKQFARAHSPIVQQAKRKGNELLAQTHRMIGGDQARLLKEMVPGAGVDTVSEHAARLRRLQPALSERKALELAGRERLAERFQAFKREIPRGVIMDRFSMPEVPVERVRASRSPKPGGSLLQALEDILLSAKRVGLRR